MASASRVRMAKLATAVILIALLGATSYAQAPAPQAKPPARKQPTTAGKSIVLVHGAWADGSSWDKVVPLLEQKGYNVVAVHLPMTSPADDIAATNRAIDRMPGDVVLVGHSFGGFIISQAGHNPKVKQLVYVDGLALDDGETANNISKTPPPWVKLLQVDSGGFAWLPMEAIKTYFVPVLPAAEQRLVYVKQGPELAAAYDEPMKNPAWKKKPTWYVRGTGDKIIDPAAQEMMAKRARAKLTSIDSGHVPMLSKPNDVAKVILDAAASKEQPRAPTAAKR